MTVAAVLGGSQFNKQISVTPSARGDAAVRALAVTGGGWERWSQRLGLSPDLPDQFKRKPLNANDSRVQVVLRKPRSASVVAPKSFSERLFDVFSALVVRLSRVAMHLDESWRMQIYEDLIFLLDEDSWNEEDPLPSSESFSAFLRSLIYMKPHDMPHVGISSRGEFMAAWIAGPERLTMEFAPEGHVRWSYQGEGGKGKEVAAGSVPPERLLEVLGPYDIRRQFNG